MSVPLLTSRDNPLVRAIRLAATQARRSSPDLVIAEGTRVLEEAMLAGSAIESVLVAEEFGSSGRDQALLAAWETAHVPVRRASVPLMREISEVVAPQGAVALIRVPRATLDDVKETSNPLLLFLCGVRDPGNLGTLLRTARATGVSLVGCTTASVSARNPKAIRASAGAFFHLPVVEGLDPAAIRGYCRNRDIRMYQAGAGAGQSCWSADFSGPAAFLLGNEARGLSASEWREVPALRIPMATGVESLNVAIAGAALLFETLRQRTATATAARS